MEMFKSATRVTLLLLIISLIGLNVYAIINYPDTVFKEVFNVFSTTVVAVTSFFFGKSSAEQTIPKDKPQDSEPVNVGLPG